MNRSGFFQILKWGLLYYLVFLAVYGVLFMVGHLPVAGKLDGLLLVLLWIENLLATPGTKFSR